MKTLRNLREAKEDYKLAPQVAELTEAFDETDEVGNTLVALNHLASIADDLYSVIGAGDVNVTPDEIDSILSAYDILAEIHDKYDDAFPMPSQDYDLDALDVEVSEEVNLQLEELELAEAMAWQMMTKTLKDLGFEPTKPSKDTWQPGTPKRVVDHMFGIPMRAGKWADTFFVIFGDDDAKPYSIVDGDGHMTFANLGDALKELKKRAKVQESTELDEAPITKTKWKVAFSYDDPSGVGIANAKITVHANDSESAKRFAETDLKKKGRFKNFRIKSASKINEESELEDVELTETPGGPSIVQKLKATRAGFQAKLDSGKYPDSEDSFKKMIAKLDTQLKAHSVKKEDVDQLDEVKVTITKWNLNKGVEGQFRMEVIGQDGSAAAKILDKVMPSAKFALFDDQFGFKTTKERDAASAALVKFYSAIKEWDTTEIPLGTISEEFDETKFRRLAMTGLVPDTDVALIIRAMKTLDAGKVLTVQQKNLIATTFQSLIGLVTGDTSVFSKIQTAVKKGATDAK
jgi:chemotaxis protein histidine kinase CheA